MHTPSKSLPSAFLLLVLSSASSFAQPQAKISNGIVRAKLFLPDPKEGYYRGSRFDWSGVMPELEYKGHSYFGQWFQKYDPLVHDAIMGPVDDFQPIGFDNAKAGESFLKIGIGMVVKDAEPTYKFTTTYPISNGGTWKTKKKADRIELTHKLNDKEYAYEYKKTVQLTKGKPEMVLSYTLKNTGKKAIETTCYNHNFFVMDKQPIGPDYDVTFPFALTSETAAPVELGTLVGNQIKFNKELVNNDHLFYHAVQGFGTTAKDYDIKIENHKTKAAVRITSNRPISKIVFWSAPKTICPEPYIQVKAQPGETIEWKIVYEFYECDAK
jgi:hypothetical protein